MSHFTVLVIGENQEEQLAPFHEFECTGINDKYVQNIEENIEDMKKEHERHLKEYPDSTSTDFIDFIEEREGKKATTQENLDIEDEHKYGYVLIDENRNVLKIIQRTNPNAKWDWYLLGGRWAGLLKLKEGRHGVHGQKPLIMGGGQDSGYDSAKKGDIDFDLMKKESEEEASKEYDKFILDLGGEELPPLWKEFREKFETIEKAREEYHKIKGVQNLNGYWDFQKFITTKDEYVKMQSIKSFKTFAVIKDGKWYEKGEMGWFGCVSDDKGEEQWAIEFNKLIEGLSDDTTISIFDCHI